MLPVIPTFHGMVTRQGDCESFSLLLEREGVAVSRLRLFIPPRLRSGQESEVERHASWLELFYDLVFVAAVAQLATSLSSDYSVPTHSKSSRLFFSE